MSETVSVYDTLLLKKDSKGYVHISLYSNEPGIAVKELTLRPEHVPAPIINRTIVFLKQSALPIIESTDIVTNIFKPHDLDVHCGFIHINVFLELESSLDGTYTKQIVRSERT